VSGYHETARTLVPLWREHAFTDVNGRYEFSDVLPGTVYLIAEKESYLRPCMTSSAVAGNTTLEIELATLTALRPLRPTPPTLRGVVYDRDMRPVAAANVFAYWFGEIPEFLTMTDDNGGYMLCGLPDDFLRGGVIRAISSRREAGHDFYEDGRPAYHGNGEFVLDLHLR
jgi:hypothetical protein